jgi:hypothetical protein
MLGADVVIPGDPAANPPTPNRKAYGWADVQLLNAVSSVMNAENYAYFGLLARLGDRGFRLPPTAPQAAAGMLTYNPPNITSKVKRMFTVWKG